MIGLDAHRVVVADVIVDTTYKRLNALDCYEAAILEFECVEPALDRRVVKAVAFAAHAMCNAASRELRAKIELMRTELDVRETALILVTHDPHIARHLADKTLTLSSAAKE